METRKPVHYQTISPLVGIWIEVSIYPVKEGGLSVFFRDITQRKEAEEQLKDFSLMLEQQVDNRTAELKKSSGELEKTLAILQHSEELAKIGSWEWKIAEEMFRWSDGMYGLFDLPKGVKVVPEIYVDYAAGADRDVAKRIVKNLRKSHKPFEETMRIDVNGNLRLLRIKASVVHDEKGKPEKMVGVDLDITDIKAAEEKVAETQMWLEQTAAASPDSITIYDLKSRQPVYLNHCLADWIQTTNEELVKMGIEGRLQLIHPDDRLKLLHFNEKVIAADGKTLTLEYRLRTKEGETIWIHNRCRVFKRDDKGKATHLLSFLQDVTEEVLLKEELKERTHFLETVLDANTDRILVLDKDLKVISWNKRAEEIYNRTKESVRSKHFLDIFPKVREDAIYMNGLMRALQGHAVHLPVRKEIYTNFFSEVFFIPLQNNKGEIYGVLNILHDVTKAFEAREELKEFNKTLEHKNRQLEAKNDEITNFAFVASHDLKEPLRKLHTFTSWLLEKEEPSLSTKGKEYIRKSINSIRRMNMLIEDILVLTKVHADKHKGEEVNLNSILERVQTEMNEAVKQHEAEIEADELPIVCGNSNQLFFLFKNIIGNAIKFHREGVPPQVNITAEIIAAGELEGFETVAEHYAKLSFTDNGVGFDMKYAQKIFHVFQRLNQKPEVEGTGIGLAVCKKIMENHDGFIEAESRVGGGTMVHCYFPL
jgi:PAS domain S-box-containing protein